MASTTYLVTGASRGLGRGLVTSLLLRENVTVIAAVRDSQNESAKSLQNLPRSVTATLLTISIDASSSTDPFSAATELRHRYGIHTLDVVIANVGIFKSFPRVSEATPEGLTEHFRINAMGPVALFQAFRPLLLESTRPRFVVTSGAGGSIELQHQIHMPLAEYGASRAAVNWLIRKVHFEEERIATLLIDPGLMDTETGALALKNFGVDPAMLKSVDECATKYLQLVDDLKKDEMSGKFLAASDRSVVSW